MKRFVYSGVFLTFALAAAACGDGNKRKSIGSSCDVDTECASGLCYDNQCLDPEADDDLDGLLNRVEVAQGSNPKKADSDDDGKADGDEYENGVAKDTDGDGVVDALESASADEDFDCLVDELDARNTISDGPTSARIGELCDLEGVCGESGAALSVMCRSGLDSAACEYTAVAGYEASEISCDEKDNDCDGVVDEFCDPLERDLLGHWPLDGDGADVGPYGDPGIVTGAIAAPDRFGNEGKALRFAAPGDRVTMASTHHPLGEATVSYTIWVRPDAGHDYETRGVVSFGETFAENKRSSLILLEQGGCAAYVGEVNDVDSQSACAPAAHWSFLAVVKEGRNVSFYHDGRLQFTGMTEEGQNLEQTLLTVGLSYFGAPGDLYEQFYGVLDDLRVYGRALSADDIEKLYRAGGIQDTGLEARPAQSCFHALKAGGQTLDGRYWIDIDGDGPRPAFQVYCDMTTDGGGWTLAWVYGFTQPDDFTNGSNAVTPRPDWPIDSADAPVSKTPPADPTTPGAIDWGLWQQIGTSFAILSDLNDGIACEPHRGSISHGFAGSVDCRVIKDVTPTCDGTVPYRLNFNPHGPSLGAQNFYYYFDGDTASDWPTHDPCGQNTTQHVQNPARWGGALYLRPTRRPVRFPEQCDNVGGVLRRDGNVLIDPDGTGGKGPFEAQCRFDLERGGWTHLSRDVVAGLEARGDRPREYFYSKGNAFYRTPVAPTVWSADTFTELVGNWVYGADDGVVSAFNCSGGATGDHGLGCGPIPSGIASPMIPRVLPDAANGGYDPDLGQTTICQGPPGALGQGNGGCVSEVDVWVRERACQQDPGSLLGGGGFDNIVETEQGWMSPCWGVYGPNGFMDAFTLDMDEFPPGGSAPSLRADNPTLGNLIYALDVTHRGFSIIQGRAYTLKFWAKAAEQRSMRVFVQPTTFDEAIYYEDITVGTEWQLFELGFDAKKTFWSVQFDFQLAESSTAAIWLDDVSISDVGASPCHPGSDGNLVGNGDFAAGRTCWEFGNNYPGRLATAAVSSTAGPEGAAGLVVENFGAAGEAWWTTVRYRGVHLVNGRRYRLTFDAKGTTDDHFFSNINGWDFGAEPWTNVEQSVSDTWRSYSQDFLAYMDTPAQGATLELAFGDAQAGKMTIANVRLVEVSPDPCAGNAFMNGDFGIGTMCWAFEWDWNHADVYPWVDAAEGGALRAVLSNNTTSFDFDARLASFGQTLASDRGYVLRFRTKAQAARRGYSNMQNQSGLLFNAPVYFDTQWKDHEFAFIPTTSTAGDTAKFEIGFGGALATGSTWFDDIALVDLGRAPCTRAPGTIANGDFSRSHICWNASNDWDQVRFDVHSDATTFGNAAPSMRLDYAPVLSGQGVSFMQPGLTWISGNSYVVAFKIRAATPTNVILAVYQEGGETPLYVPMTVGTAWTNVEEVMSPTMSASGTGVLDIQYVGGTANSVWIDDVTMTVLIPQ